MLTFSNNILLKLDFDIFTLLKIKVLQKVLQAMP